MPKKIGHPSRKHISDLSPISDGMRPPINLPLASVTGIQRLLRAGTDQILKRRPFVTPADRVTLHERAATAYGATLEQVQLIASRMHNPRSEAIYHSLKLSTSDHGRCGTLAQQLGLSRREIGSIALAMLWRELGMDDVRGGGVRIS